MILNQRTKRVWQINLTLIASNSESWDRKHFVQPEIGPEFVSDKLLSTDSIPIKARWNSQSFVVNAIFSSIKERNRNALYIPFEWSWLLLFKKQQMIKISDLYSTHNNLAISATIGTESYLPSLLSEA